MGGGRAYPGDLPVDNPTESYWQLPPHRIANYRTTSEIPNDVVWDYVVIGSGISGAAIAYKLLSRDSTLQILMLEARTAASGASGRNGGHCRAGFWLNFRRYVQALGEDEALKFERLEEENVADIAKFVREHNVDCDFRDVTTVDAYITQKAWDDVRDIVAFREEVRQRRPEAGPLTPRIVLEGEEARSRLGMNKILGAVTWPGHTQNPYRLVCHMLELSLKMGLNLQTNTPALSIEPASNAKFDVSGKHNQARWIVHTERGLIRTKKLVLATNGYTNALYPELGQTGFFWPARSQVAAIRPGSNMSNNPALKGSAGINDMGSGDYFLARAPGQRGEGDLLYGGGRSISPTRERGITDDAHVNPAIAEYLHRAPAEFFGKEAWGTPGKVVRDWSGITCYTLDTFPLVGEAPEKPGLWMSVGMNGHGSEFPLHTSILQRKEITDVRTVAMAYRSAEALVHMMTEGEEPSWFPKSFRLERAWNEHSARRVND